MGILIYCDRCQRPVENDDKLGTLMVSPKKPLRQLFKSAEICDECIDDLSQFMNPARNAKDYYDKGRRIVNKDT